jgi:tRNA uridine 5-carboxymethylaminomethyl modification enzyme
VDNADSRLMGYGRDLGLVHDDAWTAFREKRDRIAEAMSFLKKNKTLTDSGDRVTLAEHLKKPEIRIGDVIKWGRFPVLLSAEEMRYIESETKYEGYIRKQGREIAKAVRTDSLRIAEGFDFGLVPGLSREAVEKLEKKRPASLGEARRIPGMTPAAVQNIGLYLEIERKKRASKPPVPRETGLEDA